MELMTILNRCHRFRGFIYQHAHFSADKKSIEVAVRPSKSSAAVCSRCHWCRQVMRSRIEPMKNMARSLNQHREPILNYFRVARDGTNPRILLTNQNKERHARFDSNMAPWHVF
jgi:hypothetical protein